MNRLTFIEQASDWEVVPELSKSLHPFKMIAERMSAEYYPTINMVVPCLQTVRHRPPLPERTHANGVPVRNRDELVDFHYGLYENVVKRFYPLSMHIGVASLLDPRSLRLKPFSEEDRCKFISAVRNEMVPIARPNSSESKNSSATSPPSIDFSATFGDDDDKYHLYDELDQYLKRKQLPETTNVSEWWAKEGEKEFPALSRLAEKYLCIPATSIPAERVFSAMGNILTKKRLRLLPARAELLCFLREHMDILSEFSVDQLSKFE